MREKHHTEASLHNLFNTQLEYPNGAPASAAPGTKTNQNPKASSYSLYHHVEGTCDSITAFNGTQPEDAYA
jgi:hypothetical protein